jgi:DNA-binding MarR family transcriptional regulator
VVIAPERLPLSAMLAQVLVAFTIEFDNEFEHRMPHRTTAHGSPGDGPWLVSLAMWAGCMRFVGDDGVTVADLERRARTRSNLPGMRRWGYLVIDPEDPRRPGPDAVLRPTSMGRRAKEVWRDLSEVVEDRWRVRFGDDEIDRLRESLTAVTDRLEPGLPDCLPILGHGLYSKVTGGEEPGDSRLPLSALLSRVLLAFAVEFESKSGLSLAISANVLRVLDEARVRVRDLPSLTGVSKEAISMAMGVLEKGRLAAVEPDPAGGRWKVARLTPEGRVVKDEHRRLFDGIEERRRHRFDALSGCLAGLVGDATAATSPLFGGLEPYPDGWRASVRRAETLPHYPMVLHRGGFPDGS